MTDSELVDLFVAWRDDIDSVPFAHEAQWTDLPVQIPATPGQGAGCPLVLAAVVVVVLFVTVFVAQVVMAVTP